MAVACVELMETVFMGENTPLQQTIPPGAATRFYYKRGQRQTQEDPRIKGDSATDLQGRDWKEYARDNMLYLAGCTPLLSLAFDKCHSLSIVADEARVSNAQIMQIFVSTLLDESTAFGLALPPQIMPEMHIDLCHKKASVRIETTFGEVVRHPGLPSRRGRGNGRGGRAPGGRGLHSRGRALSTKIQADELAATYQCCVALDNAVQNVLRGGLLAFMPSTRPRAKTRTKPEVLPADAGCQGNQEQQ